MIEHLQQHHEPIQMDFQEHLIQVQPHESVSTIDFHNDQRFPLSILLLYIDRSFFHNNPIFKHKQISLN